MTLKRRGAGAKKEGGQRLFTFDRDFGPFRRGDIGVYRLGSHLSRAASVVLVKADPPAGAKRAGADDQWAHLAIGYLDESDQPRKFVCRGPADLKLLNSGKELAGRQKIDPPLGEVYGTFTGGKLVDIDEPPPDGGGDEAALAAA